MPKIGQYESRGFNPFKRKFWKPKFIHVKFPELSFKEMISVQPMTAPIPDNIIKFVFNSDPKPDKTEINKTSKQKIH